VEDDQLEPAFLLQPRERHPHLFFLLRYWGSVQNSKGSEASQARLSSARRAVQDDLTELVEQAKNRLEKFRCCGWRRGRFDWSSTYGWRIAVDLLSPGFIIFRCILIEPLILLIPKTSRIPVRVPETLRVSWLRLSRISTPEFREHVPRGGLRALMRPDDPL
jgi:hypothetical protein